MKNRTLREKIDEIQMVQRKAWLAGEGTTEAELATERLALSLAHWPGATGRPACGAPITARLAQGDEIDCPTCRKAAEPSTSR